MDKPFPNSGVTKALIVDAWPSLIDARCQYMFLVIVIIPKYHEIRTLLHIKSAKVLNAQKSIAAEHWQVSILTLTHSSSEIS